MYTVLPLQNLAELKTRRGNATFPNAATIASYDYPNSKGYTLFIWDNDSLDPGDDLLVVVPTVGDVTKGRWVRNDFNNNIKDLKSVALTGNYNDLSNKPTIPAAQVQSDWNASSGISQILNKPAIPAAQVQSDWNASTGLGQILNKPTIPAAQVPADWTANTGATRILNKPVFNPIRCFGPSGEVTSNVKMWTATVVPSASSGFTVDISSAGFTNIISVFVVGQQNVSSAQGALASVKADTNNQLSINVYRSAVTGVLLLNTQVPGLEFHPAPTSVELNILVLGY